MADYTFEKEIMGFLKEAETSKEDSPDEIAYDLEEEIKGENETISTSIANARKRLPDCLPEDTCR